MRGGATVLPAAHTCPAPARYHGMSAAPPLQSEVWGNILTGAPAAAEFIEIAAQCKAMSVEQSKLVGKMRDLSEIVAAQAANPPTPPCLRAVPQSHDAS